MENVTSDQNGHLYVLDLKSIFTQKTINTLNSAGTFTSSGSSCATTEPGSFVGDPATVDFDINSKDPGKLFKTDVVYYGTTSGDQLYPSGKMYRLITNNNMPSTSANWETSTLLIDPASPITSAPSVVYDNTNQIWVFFGTGRFYDKNDIPEDGDQDQFMSFFGIKDLISSATSPFLAPTVDPTDLFNSTTVTLEDDGTCYNTYTEDCVDVIMSNPDGTNSTSTWEALTATIETKSGWRHDFYDPWERVLGQASTLGGAVLFTSYLPDIDICGIEGDSRLYGLYYKTGTPYFNPIFRDSTDPFAKFIGLGKGISTSPAIHIGEGGVTAVSQLGSAALVLKSLDIEASSKVLFWRKNLH